MSTPTGSDIVDSQGPFHVVVFDAVKNIDDVATVIQVTLNLHPTDAATLARRCPAILPAVADQQQANEAVLGLAAIGLTSMVLPERNLPKWERKEQIHRLQWEEEGIVAVDMYGRPSNIIAWSSIALLAVGEIPLEVHRHATVGPRLGLAFSSREAGREGLEKTTRFSREAWMLVEDPDREFRLQEKFLNYEPLGARMTDSATVNFRNLIDEVIMRSPKIFIPAATRGFLLRDSSVNYHFGGGEELQRYAEMEYIRRQQIHHPALVELMKRMSSPPVSS